MNNFYAYTDKALMYLRRYFVQEFNRTKMQIRSDDLNVIKKTTALYDRLRKETIRVFGKIAAMKYYELHGGEDTITEMWVLDFLGMSNPLTGYIFLNDIDRKRQYFTEDVLSGANLDKAAKKALRYWYGSVRQYADMITDAAAVQAFIDTQTQFVEWCTAEDEKVCYTCNSRDGMIYPINNVPTKPHYNCRCYLRRA